MELIYQVLENILPFEFIKFDFIKNAIIAIILLAPLFAILGTMIVNNKMAFFSDALGHSALTGIAIGLVFGISNNLAMIVFAIIFSLLLNYVKHKTNYGADTIISVFASVAIAIGLAVLASLGNFSQYSSYLVGDILGISKDEIIYLAIVFLVVLVIWTFIFNKLHTISINTSLAKSKGINVMLIDNIFVVTISIVVMLSIKWIGILLINALIILPAASSRNIAKNTRTYHLFAIAFSLLTGLFGIIISYYANIPTGPAIVILAGVVYFITFALHRRIKG